MPKNRSLRLGQGWPTCTAEGVLSHSWPTASCNHAERYGRPLPTCLRMGMEKICGLSLKDVRVHYNSPLPARVQAHAYAQGRDIFLAPGQDHHLPHELGHVVQQAQGKVQPTLRFNGVEINDDPELEKEAEELGRKALLASENAAKRCI